MISIGFYTRQLVFFVGLVGILVGTGWVVKNQTGLAAGVPIAVPTTSQSLAVDLILLDHGRVQIDGTTVSGTIGFYRTYDELRYLLVDQPNTFLDRLEVTIRFPRPVDPAAARVSAIINHDLEAGWEARWLDATTLRYTVRNLGPSGSLTLVASLPKDIILPSLPQRLFGTITTLPQTIWLALALVLPLVTLAILALVFLPRWRERAANRAVGERPTPPDDLPPAAAAALVDGRVSARGIAATLLDLARRSYLDIGSHDGTFTFVKRRRLLTPEAGGELEPFETTLLSKIFSDAPEASEEQMRVRIGHHLFSEKVAAVYLDIYELVTRRGYFLINPSVTSGTYRLAGLILFFIGVLGFLFGAIVFPDPPTPLLFWAGTIAAALVIIWAAPRMSAHTATGIARRRDWLAFRVYLTNPHPISFQGENQQQFFDFLPYAVALGVESAWASRFLQAPFQVPTWYAPQAPIARWEDFFRDLFPIVGFLAQELAAVKEPTLS